MDVNDVLKIVLLTTTSTVVVLNFFLLIKSHCCNSVCIKELNNEKNNKDINIQSNNV